MCMLVNVPDIPSLHRTDDLTNYVTNLSAKVKVSVKTGSMAKIHARKLLIDLSYIVIDLIYLFILGDFTEGFLWSAGFNVFDLSYGDQFQRNDTLALIFPRESRVSNFIVFPAVMDKSCFTKLNKY